MDIAKLEEQIQGYHETENSLKKLVSQYVAFKANHGSSLVDRAMDLKNEIALKTAEDFTIKAIKPNKLSQALEIDIDVKEENRVKQTQINLPYEAIKNIKTYKSNYSIMVDSVRKEKERFEQCQKQMKNKRDKEEYALYQKLKLKYEKGSK